MKNDDDVEKVVQYTIRVKGIQKGGMKINVHQVTKGDVDNPDEQVCTPLNTSPPRAQKQGATITTTEKKKPSPRAVEKRNTPKKRRKRAKASTKKGNGTPEKTSQDSQVTPNRFNAVNKLKTQLYKTELCRSWRYAGSCRYLNKCKFAHGVPDLRPVQRSRKYKTQLCNKWSTFGFCPYGDRCQFMHGVQPSLPAIPTPFTPPRKIPIQMIQNAPMIPFYQINTLPFLMSPAMPSPPQFNSVEKRLKNCMITSPPFLTVDPIAAAEVEERTAAEVARGAYDELQDIDTQIESLEDAKLKIMLAKTQNIMHQAIRSPPPKMLQRSKGYLLTRPQLCLEASPQRAPLPPNTYNTQQINSNSREQINAQMISLGAHVRNLAQLPPVKKLFQPTNIQYQEKNAPRGVLMTINDGHRNAIDFLPRQE